MRSKIKGRFEPFGDLEIEQYLVGDLPPARREALEAQIATSADLAGYLREREGQREAFCARYPRLTVALPERPRRFARSGWLVAATAAAVLLAVVLLSMPRGAPGPIQAKGGLKASLTVLRDERTFAYRDGVLLRGGDRVRLTIEASRAGYLTVIAQDEGGKLTVYYDALKTEAGTFTVPDSLILDNSLNTEQWHILLAPAPIEASIYLERLHRKLPLEAALTSIQVAKEE